MKKLEHPSVLMYRYMLPFVLAAAAAASACSTTGKPVVANPIALQPPLPISEGQKEECKEVTPEIGESKLAIIEKANIEIDDCEKKRAGLQSTIEGENAQRADNIKKESKRLANQ